MIKNIPQSVIRSLAEQWQAENTHDKFQARLDDSSATTLLDDYLNHQGIIGYTYAIQEAHNAIILDKLPANIKEYAQRLDIQINTPMDLIEHLFTELTKGPPLPDPAEYGYEAQIPEHPENGRLNQMMEYRYLQAIQLLLSEGGREVELVNGDDGWYIPFIKGEGLFHITVRPFSGRLVYVIYYLMEARWVQCKTSYTFYEVHDFVLGEE